MRLSELNPRWVSANECRVGVRFNCPHCPKPTATDLVPGILIYIPFSNPFDGGKPQDRSWARDGEDFETLSCSPSINVTNHWHGFLINGEMIQCQ
jgi:hypothetical protein